MVGQRNAHLGVERRPEEKYLAWKKDTLGSKFGHNLEHQIKEERMMCESMIGNIEEGGQVRRNHQCDHGFSTSKELQVLRVCNKTSHCQKSERRSIILGKVRETKKCVHCQFYSFFFSQQLDLDEKLIHFFNFDYMRNKLLSLYT